MKNLQNPIVYALEVLFIIKRHQSNSEIAHSSTIHALEEQQDITCIQKQELYILHIHKQQ